MKIVKESLTEEQSHFKALMKTGFWGESGAGAIILSRNTKRFLLPLRSLLVKQPNTWGTWGGAIDKGDSPEDSVKREIQEEAGYYGRLELIPLYTFNKLDFKYFNFLAIVENEFKPKLNWETRKFQWFYWDEFPKNLHFGLKCIMNDLSSVKTIEKYLQSI